jgi:hypothetical protein
VCASSTRSSCRIREGFSLLDLKRYAQQHGFKGEGFGQLDFDDLIQDAPIIVPVDALGYNHFVIFRGVMGDRVLQNRRASASAGSAAFAHPQPRRQTMPHCLSVIEPHVLKLLDGHCAISPSGVNARLRSPGGLGGESLSRAVRA